MPSFSDSIFLFILALLLFGPKRLPVLARELGKWVGEFRRASNEFKMQMEEELRLSEQADRQKQIAAMEAAAPVAPPITTTSTDTTTLELAASTDPTPHSTPIADPNLEHAAETPTTPEITTTPEPLPIATSGELRIMPPSTGLPTPQHTRHDPSPLGGLLDSIPETSASESTHAN